MNKLYFTLVAWCGFVLGLLYLATGGIALYNWYLAIKGGDLVLPNYIPADLGIFVTFITVGALLVAPAYYIRLRVDDTKALASLLLGSGLAVAASIIQLLVAVATWVDGFITGEPLSHESLFLIITRSDALLGFIALPLFYVALKALHFGKVATNASQPQ